MKALGMIELYGYLTAVEALDSALKAANVKLVDVALVQGGLVSVFVTGDVGAVKAAMDAAKISAERVGKVITVHVIPRPSEKIEMIVPFHPTEITPSPEPPAITNKTEDLSDAVVEPQQKSSVKNENIPEEKHSPDILKKKDVKRFTVDELNIMKVDQLRSLAREIGINNMTKKEIRFATKHEIIDAISKFIEQER